MLPITKHQFDQWVKDKHVNEKIVADYEYRIRGLKDKIGLLKGEIAKPGVSNSS